MGVCGSKSTVIAPLSIGSSASPASGTAVKSTQKAKEQSKKPKSENVKPIEYRADPNITEAEREERRRKLAEAAEVRKKEELTKGMTKEGSVEYEYMLKHKKDLEKYRQQDDGKNLDWNGT